MGKDVHNKMAKFAFDEVSKIGNKDREFRSLARSFPSMIQVNGLAGALAYLFSKN